MIKVLVPIAEGTEEMEAVIIIDMLRRADILVYVASDSETVKCSRGVNIKPDISFEQIQEDEFDAIILPGGLTGTDNLTKNQNLISILKKHQIRNKMIGAICAAPKILIQNNILEKGTSITSHPSIEGMLKGYNYLNNDVVVSNNIISSRGAGTAFKFALKIISLLVSNEKADEIKKSIILTD